LVNKHSKGIKSKNHRRFIAFAMIRVEV
jgi:hypothetical protein